MVLNGDNVGESCNSRSILGNGSYSNFAPETGLSGIHPIPVIQVDCGDDAFVGFMPYSLSQPCSW